MSEMTKLRCDTLALGCLSDDAFVFVKRLEAAVGNSPPFWTNLPFHDFPKTVNH
jgi:hypothetical protein